MNSWPEKAKIRAVRAGKRGGTSFSINKSAHSAYNKGVELVTVSDAREHGAFVTYLYNAVMGEVMRTGGSGELLFSESRSAAQFKLARKDVWVRLADQLCEIVGVGYKYTFLQQNLKACLSVRERRLLCAALIAADYEGDIRFIRDKLVLSDEICIDGFYTFRLGLLREKWSRILDYIPIAFSERDLRQFCEFLVGESKHKIYVKGNAVYGENFAPLRRSRLTGEEDVETEIMLADAGFVYCVGEVEESVGKFLQKYYAERAIFS